MSECHPTVANHPALREVAKRRAELKKREAVFTDGAQQLEEKDRQARAAYQEAYKRALCAGKQPPDPPRPFDGDALRQARQALVAEGERLRDAERAALADHAEEHLAKLADAEERVMERAAALIAELSDLVPEAGLIVSTAHQVNNAVQPGRYGAAWEVDLGRLVQLAAFGGRLLVAQPVKEPSFRQWVTVDSVEG